MDMCYIDDQTKTVFMLTEYGYMAFNPKTTDFDIVLDNKKVREMRGRARVVSPTAGIDYGMSQGNQQQQQQPQQQQATQQPVQPQPQQQQ